MPTTSAVSPCEPFSPFSPFFHVHRLDLQRHPPLLGREVRFHQWLHVNLFVHALRLVQARLWRLLYPSSHVVQSNHQFREALLLLQGHLYLLVQEVRFHQWLRAVHLLPLHQPLLDYLYFPPPPPPCQALFTLQTSGSCVSFIAFVTAREFDVTSRTLWAFYACWAYVPYFAGWSIWTFRAWCVCVAWWSYYSLFAFRAFRSCISLIAFVSDWS